MYVPVNEDTQVAWSTGCQLAKNRISYNAGVVMESIALTVRLSLKTFQNCWRGYPRPFDGSRPTYSPR